MRIVLASSEAVPFSKTGGLGDVVSALAKSFSHLGHTATLFLPYYGEVHARRGAPAAVDSGLEFPVTLGARQVNCRLRWAELPGADVQVYFIDQPDYFGRADLYQENGQDYPDNSERFVFFSRAVMAAIDRLALRPHVIHANDWQTGLIPALLKVEYRKRPGLQHTASVMTIHNLAFQGQFWHWDMLLTGLDWKYFNWMQMESYGRLNLLKTGIAFATRLTTVSPTYAQEIQTPEFGCGLEGILTERREALQGILNGIDPEVWNPQVDPLLPANYGVDTVADGKPACKQALQNQLGLPERPDVPLLGMVSRLTDQKGLDLMAQRKEALLDRDVQLVVLGTGDGGYEQMLRDWAQERPQQVCAWIGFDEAMAHRIEAGADIYLMPSRYEPCGLNQMYSLAYGTVPIVRATGGLADSVVDATPETLADGTANGFRFEDYAADAFVEQVDRALDWFARPNDWRQLMRNGMGADWSWDRSAAEYLAVYEAACADVAGQAGDGDKQG